MNTRRKILFVVIITLILITVYLFKWYQGRTGKPFWNKTLSEGGHGKRYNKKTFYKKRTKISSKYSTIFTKEKENLNVNTTFSFHHLQGTDVYIYSVFLDKRGRKDVFLFLAIAPRSINQYKLQCKYNSLTIKAKVKEIETRNPPFCSYKQFFIMCDVSKQAPQQKHVSLVTNVNDKQHEMRMEYVISGKTGRADKRNMDAKHGVGLCHKLMFDIGDEHLGPLIDWFEMQKLLGITDIYLYGDQNSSGKIKKLLKHYEDEGLLHYFPWNPPVPFENRNIRDMENDKNYQSYLSRSGPNPTCLKDSAMKLAYNDCLYRNMDRHLFLAFFDMDEAVIPTQYLLIPDLLRQIQQSSNASVYMFNEYQFCSRTQYDKQLKIKRMFTVKRRLFLKDKISYHGNRNKEVRTHASHAPKSIVKAMNVIQMDIHQPRKMVKGSNNKNRVKYELGKLHHYRCQVTCTKENSTADHAIDRYEPMLTSLVSKVISDLKLL